MYFGTFAGLDDVTLVPESKVTVESSGPARKPEINERRRDEVFARIRRSGLSRSTTTPPAFSASIASSSSDTNSVHISASSITRTQSTCDSVNVVTAAASNVALQVAARTDLQETNTNQQSAFFASLLTTEN